MAIKREASGCGFRCPGVLFEAGHCRSSEGQNSRSDSRGELHLGDIMPEMSGMWSKTRKKGWD